MKVYLITSAKWEELYIKEWIDHNIKLGFDKIIINDNNPKNYKYKLVDIVKEYIDKGIVIVERYYDTHKQTKKTTEQELDNVYTWLFNKYKNECDWFAKLDIDEFLEIPETNDKIKDFLKLPKFANYMSILIPWKCYNIKKEYKYLYTYKECYKDKYKLNDTYFYRGFSFKSIFRSNDLISEVNWHYVCVDTEFICFGDGNKLNMSYDELNKYIRNNNDYVYNKLLPIIYINHLLGKSLEEEYIKLKKIERYKWDPKYYKTYYETITNDFSEKYPKLVKKERDLYKLYFQNNAMNIAKHINK